MHDIERAQKLSLDGTITMVSSSTDPFQPIEKTVRDSHFAIKQLLANNFPVLIMTRNPGMLLEQEYVELTKNPKLFVDVSIASLHENSLAPPINERLTAIKSLSAMGKLVRVKVDPIVPIVDGVKYQTEKELNEIVRLSKEAGSQMIIAKTMRLNDDVPEGIRHVLADYYQKSGSRSGINLVLSVEARKRLITPVINACTEYGIPFCPCVDLDSLSDERTVCCIVIGEQKTPITEVMKG
jgi:DNA repair photolyase